MRYRSKDVAYKLAALKRAAQENGTPISVHRNGSGHYEFHDEHDRVIRLNGTPITCPSTPKGQGKWGVRLSDELARAGFIKRIVKTAGVKAPPTLKESEAAAEVRRIRARERELVRRFPNIASDL